MWTVLMAHSFTRRWTDYGGCFPRMKGKEVFQFLAFGVDGFLILVN